MNLLQINKKYDKINKKRKGGIMMDFFDETIDKVKEVAEVVGKKTNEVVSVQKLKFNISSLENKISKDYEVLGKLYYEAIANGESASEDAMEIVGSIEGKTARIEEIKKEIKDIKND